TLLTDGDGDGDRLCDARDHAPVVDIVGAEPLVRLLDGGIDPLAVDREEIAVTKAADILELAADVGVAELSPHIPSGALRAHDIHRDVNAECPAAAPCHHIGEGGKIP